MMLCGGAARRSYNHGGTGQRVRLLSTRTGERDEGNRGRNDQRNDHVPEGVVDTPLTRVHPREEADTHHGSTWVLGPI